jgi:hypothetical protein
MMIDKLKNAFKYKNGNLYWKIKSAPRILIGDKAGCLNKKGYIQIRLDGECYLAHRIIFAMHHGFMPEFIDHIDGNPSNNLIENLRECNLSQNQYNSKLRTDNKSGIKGVCWKKKANKWQVRLAINGKIKYFGEYFDIKVAKFVAETMRHKYHKEFTNHG